MFKQSIDLWFLVAKTIVKFHCFARFEEVVALKWNNIKFLDDGNVEITFTKGKNNQFHHAHTSVITKCINSLVHCPVNILKKFYLVLGSPDKTSFFLPKFFMSKFHILFVLNSSKLVYRKSVSIQPATESIVTEPVL